MDISGKGTSKEVVDKSIEYSSRECNNFVVLFEPVRVLNAIFQPMFIFLSVFRRFKSLMVVLQ